MTNLWLVQGNGTVSGQAGAAAPAGVDDGVAKGDNALVLTGNGQGIGGTGSSPASGGNTGTNPNSFVVEEVVVTAHRRSWSDWLFQAGSDVLHLNFSAAGKDFSRFAGSLNAAAPGGSSGGNYYGLIGGFQPSGNIHNLADLRQAQYIAGGGSNIQTTYWGSREAFVAGVGGASSQGLFVTTKTNPDLTTSVIDKGGYITAQASAGADLGGGLESGIKPGKMADGKLELTWGLNFGIVGLQGDFAGGNNPSLSHEPRVLDRLKENAGLKLEFGGTINAERTWLFHR